MPTLVERLGLAWKAISPRAEKAPVGVYADDIAQQAHGMLMGIYPGSVGAPPQRGSRERVAAYAEMPWLHAVAEKVASAMASVHWTLAAVRPAGAERAVRVKALQRAPFEARRAAVRALRAQGTLVPVEEHPLLDVFHGGNGAMTGVDMRKMTSLHLDLEGEAFWLKERNALGVIVGAWPVPPYWIMSTPTPRDRRFRVGFRGWQGWIPDTELVWFRSHDPVNPYGRGTGIARALADELETDEYAARFVRQTFFNQARPDFLIFPKNNTTLSEPERVRLQHNWEAQHQGFWRAFRGRFASRELGVHEFQAHDFRHLQMIQLREHERNVIIQTWGVPLSFLGVITPGHSRATLGVETYIFARWVLVPRLEAFRAMLQERLVPEYDERLVLDYESPVESDRATELEAAKSFPGTLRIDEWRNLQGQEPLDDGDGQGFLVPLTLAPLANFAAPAGAPAVPENEENEAAALVRSFRAEERARREEDAIVRRASLEYLSGGGATERMASAVADLARAVAGRAPTP